jgi:hypothetical protein
MTDTSIWIALPFNYDELDGKSVEYETVGKGTATGFLSVRQNPAGLFALQIRVETPGDPAQIPDPLEELLSFATLQRHPLPRRADFLLAKHADELLPRMG